MPLLRLSQKIVRAERFSAADLFDVHLGRVIAQGRLLLCVLSLVAIQLDPTEPLRYAAATYSILLAYLAFAIAIVAVSFGTRLPPGAPYFIHAIDIIVISVLMFLTEGQTSALLVFVPFVLLSAMMRWNWQAVALTTCLMAGILALSGMVQFHLTGAAIIRSAYLLVAGGMLAYVSAFRERQRERLTRMAEWGAHGSSNDDSGLAEALAYAASVFEAPRIVVVWKRLEEPFVNVATWHEGMYQNACEDMEKFGQFVNLQLQRAAFLTEDATKNLVVTRGGPLRVELPVIDRELRMKFHMGSVASAPFDGTICAGRVFLLDRDNWSDDHVLLTQIVSSRIGMELDRQLLRREAEHAAVAQERIRLTRDLHDGILQSLTAAGLQLKLLSEIPEDRQSRLAILEEILETEQRRIRSFVHGTIPRSGRNAILRQDLQQVLSECARLWNCATSLSVTPPDASVPAARGVQICFMLAEAVANAVRHGGASKIDVTIEKAENHLVIDVCDNGRGFPGLPDQCAHQGLGVSGAGPVSLRDRVSEIGGSLMVANSPRGAELHIRIPVS